LGSVEYVAVISHALKEAFGDSRSAIKAVARSTGAHERAVRNWFDGKNAPSGQHLINLMRQSDVVFEAVLVLSCRSAVLEGFRTQIICRQLRNLLEQMERVQARE